jgi:hypothetical protein
MAGEAEEAISEAVVAVLGLGDFDAVGDVVVEGEDDRAIGAKRLSLRQAENRPASKRAQRSMACWRMANWSRA